MCVDVTLKSTVIKNTFLILTVDSYKMNNLSTACLLLTASSEHSYACITDDPSAETSHTHTQDPPVSAEGMLFVFQFRTI